MASISRSVYIDFYHLEGSWINMGGVQLGFSIWGYLGHSLDHRMTWVSFRTKQDGCLRHPEGLLLKLWAEGILSLIITLKWLFVFRSITAEVKKGSLLSVGRWTSEEGPHQVNPMHGCQSWKRMPFFKRGNGHHPKNFCLHQTTPRVHRRT